MADEIGGDSPESTRSLEPVKEENGSLSSEADTSTSAETPLPRRSSLIKDTTRRRSRKKLCLFLVFQRRKI